MTTAAPGESIGEGLEEMRRWLDLLARALEHPDLDDGGRLVFRSTDVRKAPPLPRLPGGDKVCQRVDHVHLTVADLADVVQSLRAMAVKLANQVG